tara:strand:+ start:290 stop:565 length:276 start_codon:yes stop_codon:yes gene_type:complete
MADPDTQTILANLAKIQAKTDLLSQIAFDVHWFDANSDPAGEPSDGIFHQIVKNQQTIIDQNKALLQNLLDGQGENNNSFTDILNWINKEK